MGSWFNYALYILLIAEIIGFLTAYVQADLSLRRFLDLTLHGAYVPFLLGLVLTILCLCCVTLSRRADLGSYASERRFVLRYVLLWPIIYALWGVSGVFTASAFLSMLALTPGAVTERSAVILAVNDVYRVEGVEGGVAGGIARLRSIRAELERQNSGRVLFLHAGDVIFPSLLSRMYEGKQMIDVLNLMDGNPVPGRLDERMFVVFGNHEFEKEESCEADSVLQKRVAESDFYWLHSNIALKPCPNSRLKLVGSNLLQAKIIEVGGIHIGLFGLTIDTQHPSFMFMDPFETARNMVTDLRRRGAEVVIALTHLNKHDDELLYQFLRGQGLDLIIGGHDHVRMQIPDDDPRIFKADADAVTAWVIELKLAEGGQLKVTATWRELRETVHQDPLVRDRVAGWMQSHEGTFCKKDGAPPNCLAEELGVTETRLVAREEEIRRAETSLGNWIADQMMETFKDCQVEAAFINSGGLRLNQDLPKNTPITRRHIEELFQYKTPLYLLEPSGEQLQAAIENSISKWDTGGWLQVSHLTFIYEPSTKAVSKLLVRPPGQDQAIDVKTGMTRKFRVVTNEYMVDKEKNIDGYPNILPEDKDERCKASGTDLKRIVSETIKRQGRIAPKEEGRICTASDAKKKACQADTWLR